MWETVLKHWRLIVEATVYLVVPGGLVAAIICRRRQLSRLWRRRPHDTDP